MIDISVVVPIYKESHYLKRLLENLARQSWAFRTEIILCEYESSGASARIIGDFRQQYPDVRIRLIEIFEKGIASARNEGIMRASGAIICNLDADNIFDDSFALENLCTPIVQGEAVMTFSRIKFDVNEARNEKERQELRSRFISDMVPVIITGTCFLKSVWQECGGLQNIDPYEMIAFALRVYWLYPFKVRRAEDVILITSPRRALKEKELGLLEGHLKRTTAVRGEKILWGDEESYD